MTHSRQPTQMANRSYQYQIATNLVKSLGIDLAIDVCSRNRWDGIMNEILKDDRHAR